jgi:S1-C subfamily serine protease
MPEQSESGSPRICPSCERRVPPRVGQCRCGYSFSPAPVEVAAAVEPEEPSAARAWVGPTVIIVLVLAAVIVYMMRPAPKEELEDLAIASQTPARPKPPAAGPAVLSNPVAAPAPGSAARLIVASPLPAAPLPSATSSFEEIVGNAAAAVVSIETGSSRGTGFFVTPELIVTNAHVVQNNGSVTVKLSDGTAMPARVLRSSPVVDIAIVRPDTPQPGQSIVPMGSGNGARPGQEVIAIGSALGVLQNTVTRGIVSAVRNANGVVLIQTDAAINPGNSGGPLIDRSGRVIGITTLKVASNSGTNSESLGFAVAIDHARPLLEGRPAELVTARPGSPVAQGPLAGAFAPDRSQSDTDRDQGSAFYDRAMQTLARRADSIDDYWNRFRAACRPAGPFTSGDREWFTIWDRLPAVDPRDGQCTQWLTELTQLANSVRASMSSADETARTAAVYPGVRRDLRKKYKLDWDGWER